MAAQLYSKSMNNTDAAYPLLIKNLIPAGLRGAIAGAVISSLASMLNSALTIFTLDLYKVYIKKDAAQHSHVFVGSIMTLLFVLIGCFIAPYMGDPQFLGIFTYIQEFQGYISSGILAAFVFEIVVKKAPPAAGVTALLACVPVYGFLQWQFNEIAFLNRMAITIGVVLLLMTIITILKSLKEPVQLPKRTDIDLSPTPQLIWWGSAVIFVTLMLYVVFW